MFLKNKKTFLRMCTVLCLVAVLLSSCSKKQDTDAVEEATSAGSETLDGSESTNEPTPIDPTTLTYYPIFQEKEGDQYYGYNGCSIAYDQLPYNSETTSLYLYVEPWDAYLKAPFQYRYFVEKKPFGQHSRTATVCGDFAWVIVSNERNGFGVDIVRIPRNGGDLIFGEIQLEPLPTGTHETFHKLSCFFFDRWNGKLFISRFDEHNSYYMELYETHDGGATWTQVQSDTIPHSIGGAKQARSHDIMYFLNERVGLITIHYYDECMQRRTFLTFDGGKTWERISGEFDFGTDNVEAKDFRFLQDGLLITVVVKTYNNAGKKYLFSSDNGETWTMLSELPE